MNNINMVKWTIYTCKQEALKYNTISEYIKNSSGSYSAAYKNKWLDYVCSHMKNKPKYYWTKERCKEEISKYNTLLDFNRSNHVLLNYVYHKGWSSELLCDLKRFGSKYNRCIYSYEFPDNHVYVGLTYNINERQKDRDSKHNDSVTKYINKTNLIPIRKQLTDYLPVEIAIIKEGEFLEKYKLEGWEIINIAKTGGIGGTVFVWDKDKCASEALKYKTRFDFQKKASGAYDAAHRNGWLDEITIHMLEFRKHRYYWTKERCIEEVKKYKTFNEFKKNSISSYVTASKNKWIDELKLIFIKNE